MSGSLSGYAKMLTGCYSLTWYILLFLLKCHLQLQT